MEPAEIDLAFLDTLWVLFLSSALSSLALRAGLSFGSLCLCVLSVLSARAHCLQHDAYGVLLSAASLRLQVNQTKEARRKAREIRESRVACGVAGGDPKNLRKKAPPLRFCLGTVRPGALCCIRGFASCRGLVRFRPFFSSAARRASLYSLSLLRFCPIVRETEVSLRTFGSVRV